MFPLHDRVNTSSFKMWKQILSSWVEWVLQKWGFTLIHEYIHIFESPVKRD